MAGITVFSSIYETIWLGFFGYYSNSVGNMGRLHLIIRA